MSKNILKRNVLLCCTGSVAAIKAPEITNLFREANLEVCVIFTQKALHFCEINDVNETVMVHTDEDEWSQWNKRGDPVLHINLAKWADIMVIAPLDANTLAKISHGMCDNLLTCVARAWDMSKPSLFCPAMNTKMWQHPVTAGQIATLKSWGYEEIPCISKVLMCGDEGPGAMAEPSTIVNVVIEKLRA